MKRLDFLKLVGGGILYGNLLMNLARAGENEVRSALPVDTPSKIPFFVNSGPGFGNRVALTYDDGPSPGVTELVLKELEKRNAKATFFMIGKKVKEYSSLAKEVVAAGHEVANHTYTHRALNTLDDSTVRDELHKTQDIIHSVTGVTPVWFRPPYGAFRKNQGNMPMEKNLGIALWSVDPRDWAQPGVQSIVNNIRANSHPGSIILLHDLHKQTAIATPLIFDALADKNFHFVKLSTFLGEPYHQYPQIA